MGRQAMSIAGFDHCAITVRDIERSEIEEGPVRRPASDGQVGQSVYFRDPDGNLLELLSTRAD